MMLFFLFFLSILLIGFNSPSYAQWEKAESGILSHQSFQVKVGKGRALYYCRDKYTNFGIISNAEGCRLIYGSTVVTQDYEILVDPDHNLRWIQVKQGKIPLGAFDAGRTPLLGKKYLCLKTRHGVPYQGIMISGHCHYRFKAQIHKTKKFQILVNLWVDTKKIPVSTIPSGKDASGNQYICRVRHHGMYYPGTVGMGIRICKFVDDYGYEMNREDYQVQLYLPHKWVRGKPAKFIKNMVNAGDQSQYYICRAKLLKNVYIGKIKKDGHYCSVTIGGGHLNLKTYQLQVWKSY